MTQQMPERMNTSLVLIFTQQYLLYNTWETLREGKKTWYVKKKKVPWLLKRETNHELVKSAKFLQRWSRESTGGGGGGQIDAAPLDASPSYNSMSVCLVFYGGP